jgi:predicted RNA methylase
MLHVLKSYVDEHTHMLDPTCGSGSAIKACAELAPRATAIGLEIDAEAAEISRTQLEGEIRLRRLSAKLSNA